MASEVSRLLQEGIAAARAGRPEQARERLLQVIELDDHNEQAWLWLSQAVESDEDRYICMENILSINPNNAVAKAGLEYLRQQGVRPPEPEEPPPAAGEQQFAEEKLPDWLQQEAELPSAEEFPWLSTFGEEQAPPAQRPPQEEEQAQSEELPSWLGEPEPEWDASVKSAKEEAPAWLESPWMTEMEAQFGSTEETPRAVTEEAQPAQAAPAWVEEETAPAWIAEGEKEAPAEKAPDWLETIAAGEPEKEKEAEAMPAAEPAPAAEKPRRGLPLAKIGLVLGAIVLCSLLAVVGVFVVAPMLQEGLPVPQPPVITPDSNFANVPVYPGAELLQYIPGSTDSWERYKLTNVQPEQVLDFYKKEMLKAGWVLSQEDAKSATFTGEGRRIYVSAEPYKDFILLNIGQHQDPNIHRQLSPPPPTATPSPSTPTPAPTNTRVVQ
jgi:hypothetical protein